MSRPQVQAQAAAKSRLAVVLRRTSSAMALDAHVFATLLFRSWAVVAGVVTVVLIPGFMRKEEQGYYFTFSSLVSIQIFFELGFNYVVAQLTSHEVAHVKQFSDADGSSDRHAARIASLLSLARRWYRVMALAFGVAAMAGGAWFFSRQHALPPSAWLGPWVALSLAAAGNLYLSPFLAIAEGAGRIAGVARLRLIQSAVGYASMWSLLAAGAGLWAAVAVPLWSSALTAYWVRHRENLGLPSACFAPVAAGEGIRWSQEILPLQWRIALSWASGYFIFQLFNPFVFAFQGAVAAGRTGLALAAFTAISGLGMSWINAKSPAMSGLIARGERAVLNAEFKRVFWRATAFTAIVALGFVAFVEILRLAHVQMAGRIADLPVLLLLAGTTITNSIIAGMAIYMRCHKEEPLLVAAIVVAVLTTLGVALGARIDVVTPFVAYFLVTFVVSLPWTVVLFITYWRRTT